MARGITIERLDQSKQELPNGAESFRIQVTAKDAVMMPEEIFLFARTLVDSHTGAQGEEFQAVISPDDAVIYPVGEPTLGQQPPFYRKSTIDVLLASEHQADQFWEELKLRVCALVEAYNKKDRLIKKESFRCGDPVADESSVSESETMSASMSESV